jgi:plasmid stabilization system protein ParE
MEVIWRKKASDELEAIFNFIKKESPQNAVMVFNSVFDLVNSLVYFPYKFPKEPNINIENVRFAVIWSFKIVYVVKENLIVVLRVFNTSQNPKKLKK